MHLVLHLVVAMSTGPVITVGPVNSTGPVISVGSVNSTVLVTLTGPVNSTDRVPSMGLVHRTGRETSCLTNRSAVPLTAELVLSLVTFFAATHVRLTASRIHWHGEDVRS